MKLRSLLKFVATTRKLALTIEDQYFIERLVENDSPTSFKLFLKYRKAKPDARKAMIDQLSMMNQSLSSLINEVQIQQGKELDVQTLFSPVNWNDSRSLIDSLI